MIVLASLQRIVPQLLKQMTVQGAQEKITAVVLTWEGVSAQPHRFGGTEYVIGKREIGHIHGDRWLDIPFPTKVRDELVARGEVNPHHILPDSGWITFTLDERADVAQAIALLKCSYDIARCQKRRRGRSR
jgi:hypothetical protein